METLSHPAHPATSRLDARLVDLLHRIVFCTRPDAMKLHREIEAHFGRVGDRNGTWMLHSLVEDVASDPRLGRAEREALKEQYEVLTIQGGAERAGAIRSGFAGGLAFAPVRPLVAARTIMTQRVPSGLGDLSRAEAAQIQSVTDRWGRDVWVIGSAARGTRRNPARLDFPIGKGPKTRSDIDYLVQSGRPPPHLVNELPGVDAHGPIWGTFDARWHGGAGSAIIFRAHKSPKLLP